MKKNSADAMLALIGGKGGKSRKKGKKGRKIGRSKRHPAAQRYTGEKRWIVNRVRRMRRHMKKFPNDKQTARHLAASGG